VLDNIRETMENAGLDYQILIVDDGSQDTTAAVAEAKGFQVLRHPENRGYGAAPKSGIRHTAYDLVATTDADGTYPRERLPDLFRHTQEGSHDMVVAAQTGAQVHTPLVRRPANEADRGSGRVVAQKPSHK